MLQGARYRRGVGLLLHGFDHPAGAQQCAQDLSRHDFLQGKSKKQGHRKSFRDDNFRGTSSSAAAKVPLFSSLFCDEGMDVTRLLTCLKAELSRVMLDLSAEEEKQKTAKTKKARHLRPPPPPHRLHHRLTVNDNPTPSLSASSTAPR